MARQLAWVLVMALASSAAPAAALAQPPRGDQRGGREARPQDNRWKWWMNPDDRRELGITDQQSLQIERIWSETVPVQRERHGELGRLEAELSRTLKDATADPAAVALQVEKVENLRAAIATTRTIMLYRISQLLTPDQRARLEAHRARREENRRKQTDKDKPGRG